jgi:hypothetical protein
VENATGDLYYLLGEAHFGKLCLRVALSCP